MVLLLLLLLLAAPAWPAAAQPDPAFLQRLEQLRRVAREAGNDLWPGWDPTATPLAIHKGTEMAVLVGHPAPPAQFRRIAAPDVSAPVYVADSTAGMVRANTAQPFAGTLTSFFSYDDFMNKPAPEALALAIHELFHAHLSRIAPRKFGDILVVLWGKYPQFSARNRALLALEAEQLYQAVTEGKDDEARKSAAAFGGIRAERRKDLTPELARYESGEESGEGLARYIELQVLRRLARAQPGDRQAAESAEKLLEPLRRINALERDRDRFYALGMAQAALLDRLRPGWKKEYESGPLLLDDLVAAAVPGASQAETAGIIALNGFPRLLSEQQQAVAQRREEGTQRLASMLSAPGERLVVYVEELKNKIGLRGINPNGSVQLSPDQVLHTFLLLDLGAEPGARIRLEFRGIPAVYDQRQDAFWFVLPPAAVAKSLEAYTRETEGAPRLVLNTQGFYGEFTGVEVERRGRELRIRPAKDLQRQPALKPPEFVRPDRP